MIINPTMPVRPILPSLFPFPVTGWNIKAETVVAILFAIALIGIGILSGWLLTKIMSGKGFKTNLAVNLSLSGVMALALTLRFGMSATVLQGLAFFFVLLFASCSDLTSHTMDDYLWVMMLCLGLASIPTVGLSSMLLGATMVFLPQLFVSLLPSHKALGGADIKLATSVAFLLGWQRGLAALLLGLLAAVIVMSIVQRVRKNMKKQPFALIPFLSAAAVVLFLI